MLNGSSNYGGNSAHNQGGSCADLSGADLFAGVWRFVSGDARHVSAR